MTIINLYNYKRIFKKKNLPAGDTFLYFLGFIFFMCNMEILIISTP